MTVVSQKVMVFLLAVAALNVLYLLLAWLFLVKNFNLKQSLKKTVSKDICYFIQFLSYLKLVS